MSVSLLLADTLLDDFLVAENSPQADMNSPITSPDKSMLNTSPRSNHTNLTLLVPTPATNGETEVASFGNFRFHSRPIFYFFL